MSPRAPAELLIFVVVFLGPHLPNHKTETLQKSKSPRKENISILELHQLYGIENFCFSKFLAG